VAIKTLTSDAISDPESRSRFEREARAAAKLSHPSIVTIFELGNFGGREKPYIVMEYLEGTDVAALVGSKEGVPFAEALEIVVQLCRALDFAHQKGVVHRDVKPSNLRYLDNGQVKIMDFGIARLEGSHQITKSGVMIGTLHYMSPEQIRGEKLDGRTDIFAAGCILYELLAGVRPFVGESATSILYNIVNENPKPVVEKNAELPHEIQDILDRALAKRPEERFAAAGDMARELEKILTIYRKTLPRTTVEHEKTLQDLEGLARDHRWRELAKAAKKLLADHPQLDDARRLLRRALREIHREDTEKKQSPDARTKHLAELSEELTELYGRSAVTTRGPSALDETEVGEPTKAVTGTVPAGDAGAATRAVDAGTEASAVRALAAPIWALVFVALLGIAGGLYWMFLREPPGPVSVSHVLTVYSDPPGASISLNGRPTGLVTDEDGVELPVTGFVDDSVLVEMRLEGFEPASSDVLLREVAPDPLEFVLARTVRTFELRTSPPGATVRLDGKAVEGVTPLVLELSKNGDHEITISKDEYRSATLKLEGSQPLPEDPVVLQPLGRPGTFSVETTYPVGIRRGDSVLAPESLSPTVQLRPGTYELRLVATGVFLDRTVQVQIREAETTTIRAPALGRVNVRANPGNCTVTINGISAGAPPFMNREIVEGSHEFVFTWPGDARDVQQQRVEAGKPAYVIGQRR
jgi:serine/threonine protein kinase